MAVDGFTGDAVRKTGIFTNEGFLEFGENALLMI
jgi:hypothetical protein